MKIILTFLILTITGCVPVPAYYYSKQPINGALTYQGSPIAGVTVGYDDKPYDFDDPVTCKNPISSTTTNELGEFKLAGKERFFYFISLLGPAENRVLYKLCFSEPEKGQSYWMADGVGYPGEKEEMIVGCSLKFPETKCQIR